MKAEGANDEAGRAEEEKHLEIVEGARAGRERPPDEGRRGSGWQRDWRELERSVRAEAVEYRSFVVIEGGTRTEAASDLGLSPRTLFEWAERIEKGALKAKARGRPLKDSGPMKRNEVIRFIKRVGPAVGVGRIRGVFPEMPRCEVTSIVRCYRRVYVRDHMLLLEELEWTMPGAVWAMDHAVPPAAIEGRYGAIFAARDLACGEQLLWEPVESEDAREVILMLDVRIAVDNAPLVMKSDNGSAFIAEETKEFLERHGVIQLLSPPAFPQYNGSIESAIGSMKDRTSWKALLGGRPKEWTREDLEAARVEANELPRGPGMPSAGDVWRNRPAITPELRAAFRASVAAEEARERSAYGIGLCTVVEPRLAAEIQRTAIRRALVAHGILRFRRRRIPLPKRLLKRAKIS